MRGLYRKMSALLLSLGLAIEPGLAALPGHTGLQSYAAENATQDGKASASNLKRSNDEKKEKKQDSKAYFGAAALLKASASNLSRSGEDSISLAAETGDMTDSTEKVTQGRALIIAQTGDESLKDGPKEDAEALMKTLLHTAEFSDSDNITVLEVPQSAEDDSYRQAVWNWIDTAVEEGSELNLIAYTGHGDYHSDGNSELSLGKNNNISAQELKQHVSKLSGKVILAIDCCYSGGMIMPTSLEDELEMDTTVSASDEADLQEMADREMQDFVSDFRKAKAASPEEDNVGASNTLTASAGSSALQYYIYAAASAYETSIQGKYGGQLLVALGHALGYDRNDADYHVFAADTEGEERAVTAAELAAYVKNSCTVATPTVYPSSGEEVLFSYADDYYAAEFSVRSAETQNVKLNKDGSITVKVRVKNLSDDDITLNAMAGTCLLTEMDMPGDADTVLSNIEGKYHSLILQADDTVTIKGGKNENVKLTFTGDPEETGLSDGGRFLVRLWDEDNPVNYGITDFYVGVNGEDAEAPDVSALALRKPAVVSGAEDAIEVSAMVPINVQFDTEPTEKEGYAACTLTARYYDLGESSGANAEKNLKGYQVDTAGQISADDNVVIDDKSGWQTIYKDVRPTYTRTDIYAETLNGSTYNSVWDVTGLETGHYYALQLICSYGDGTSKKLATFIKKVDKTTADAAENVIGEVNIASRYFAENYNGIRLGENWNSNTVATVSENYTEYLNSQSFTCRTVGEGEKKQNIPYLHASVEGPKGGSGWYELDADGEFDGKTEMAEDAVFEPGKSYVSRIHLTIDETANARFADSVLFTVAGHTLYDDKVNASGVLNTREAVIYVRHDNIGVDESKLKVYRAGTKEVLADGASLNVGDQLDIACADGYGYRVDSCLWEIKGNFGNVKRYEVLGTDNSASIVLYHKFSGKVETQDSCGAYMFLYPINDADTSVLTQGDTFTISGDFAEKGKDTLLSAAEKENVVLVLDAQYKDMENGEVTVTVTHSLRLKKAGVSAANWPVVEPRKDAKISYLIPYPTDRVKQYRNSEYKQLTKDGEIEAAFEVQQNGLWITVGENGSFTLFGKFPGGDDGGIIAPDVDDDEDEQQNGQNSQSSQSSQSAHSSGGHSRGSSTPTSRAVSGSWQKSTQDPAAGAVVRYRFRLSNGKDATGWQLIRWNNAEHWFYFGQDGYMCTGWIQDGDKWYFLEKDGTMALGWHLENGSWYYLEGSGSMVTGWFRVGLSWYYFGSDGKMQTGRQLINGTQHSFREDGSWISNQA